MIQVAGRGGAKMQGASVALAKPNGPVRAYRIIRAVRAVPLVGVFHRTLRKQLLSFTEARARDHLMVMSPVI